MPEEPAVRARDFESREVYRSAQRPGYTSWVSFFPGERGQWYIGCEEVTRPDPPLPRCSPEQWFGMGLPTGYDKSPFRMEAVLLESADGLETWRVVSRTPYRHHHTVGQFGTCRTRDGRFLRFIWACYSLDPSVAANRIGYGSDDDGRSWRGMPAFHHDRFAGFPHRLRTLRDGTLVLCLPLAPRWGTPERPSRTCRDLLAVGEMQMNLCVSFDQGRTWENPLPVLGGQTVSETDFVELPSGDLLLVNNSIFATPGRQVVYREGRRFTPGPLERSAGQTGLGEPNRVPETICLAEDGILVGCLRAGSYHWSDDLGRTWNRLEGIPSVGPQVYQPWIHRLPDGRIACAGHYGRDAPVRGERRDDQYISLHLFRLECLRRTRETRLRVEREVDPASRRWRNAYTLALSVEGRPLPGREVEFWYVERDQPGYDPHAAIGLAERMAAGGRRVTERTGEDGKARVDLSHFDRVTDPHHCIQFVARFNADGRDPEHRPCQTCQFNQYSIAAQDPPL